MAELDTLFSWFCGQWTDHTWRPGGVSLPFCQRCTGLYLGAFLAITLQIVFRRPLSRRRLWIDSLLLLQMVPFGYHWLPQDATVRTLTGFLFAFGLVGFLWRLPAKVWPTWKILTANGGIRPVTRDRGASPSPSCATLSEEVPGAGNGSCNEPPPPRFLWLPLALAALGFALLLACVHLGDRTAAHGLSVLGLLGWLGLALLSSLNIALLCQSLVQKVRLPTRPPRDTPRPAP